MTFKLNNHKVQLKDIVKYFINCLYKSFMCYNQNFHNNFIQHSMFDHLISLKTNYNKKGVTYFPFTNR